MHKRILVSVELRPKRSGIVIENKSTPSITHCPICGYSLEGLPAVHRCPECFFEYDEFTHAWTNKKLATWAIVFPPFAGVMVYFVVREIHRNSWWTDPLILTSVVMLFLAFAYRIFKMKRVVGKKETVCVHAGGLLIRSHSHGEMNYKWEELRAIGPELIGAPWYKPVVDIKAVLLISQITSVVGRRRARIAVQHAVEDGLRHYGCDGSGGGQRGEEQLPDDHS